MAEWAHSLGLRWGPACGAARCCAMWDQAGALCGAVWGGGGAVWAC